MSVWVGERDLALLLPHLQRKHWQLSTGGSSLPLLLRPSPLTSLLLSHLLHRSLPLTLSPPLYSLLFHTYWPSFCHRLTRFPNAVFTFHYVHPSFPLHCLFSLLVLAAHFYFFHFFLNSSSHDCVSVHSLAIPHQAARLARCWSVCC